MVEEAVSGAPAKWPKSAVAVVMGLVLLLAAISAAFYVSTLRVQPPGETPAVPAAPGALTAVAGDGTLTLSWSAVSGADSYNLYIASEPGVTAANYASKADGARFPNVASPYLAAGLVNGRAYYARLTAENTVGESAESAEASAMPFAAAPPLYVTGLVEFDNGEPVEGASVTVRSEDGGASASGTTGADGRYTAKITPAFPTRALSIVRSQSPGEPAVTGFRWSPIREGEGAVDVGRIVLPRPEGKELGVAGTTADGHVLVDDLPPEVDSVWAKDYEPDLQPDLFPGDLAEGRSWPINSVTFVWISALDAAGNQVFDLSTPATVRLRVFPTQWHDLDDLQPGNGVIDTPIYSLDYATGYWVREPDGILTDAAGAALPEGAEAAILSGTYPAAVYAQFQADHFSWWNVDKPPKGCGEDFGDAPDPTYPSLLLSDGARHLTICRIWLGPWADGETDANVPDLDRYDDSLLSVDPLAFRVSNWDWPGNAYVNVLIDRDRNGSWSDAGEWVVQNHVAAIPQGKSGRVETEARWDGDSWMRVTLTGAPITAYDGHGEFPIGETEDYPFLEERLVVDVTGNGTVTSDPPGIDCRKRGDGTCSLSFRHGTTVNLTATPDPGESFLGWGGDCRLEGTNATCSLLMDRARYATAAFTQPYWDLTVSVVGSGNVTSAPPGIDCEGNDLSNGTQGKTCRATFARDTLVTLTAVPDAPEDLAFWSGDCSGIVGPTCEVLMDRDRFVYVQFRRPLLYVTSEWNMTGSGNVTSDPPGIDCHLPRGNPGGGNYTNCYAYFDGGITVTLTATPDPGYSFLEWGGDCSGTAPTCTLIMDRDHEVSARFG